MENAVKEYQKTTEDNRIVFHKPFVFAVMATIFNLAYIASPYWTTEKTIHYQILCLVTTAALGGIWALWAGSEITVTLNKSSLLLFLLIGSMIFAFNATALFASIPYRGDEDYHIGVVQYFLGDIRHLYPALLVCLMFIYSAWRRSKWTPLIGIVSLAFFIMYGYRSRLDPSVWLRYPFFSRYLQALFPALMQPFIGLYHEAVYRVVPFFAATAIAWFGVNRPIAADMRVKLLIGAAVASIPLLHYYSSILYLEMPAVALMVAVCLNIEDLLKSDYNSIKKHPTWIALLLIGFIKETTVVFIAIFILCRLVVQLHHGRKQSNGINIKNLSDEFKIAFCVFLPLSIYLVYRISNGTARTFAPQVAHLTNWNVYATFIRSFGEQFGVFFVLFIGGCIVLYQGRKWVRLLFLILLVVATTGFFALDQTRFAGYSRFNLFLLPAVVVGFMEFMEALRRFKGAVPTVLCLSIGMNLLLSPVYLDGSKKPYWGNYRYDTSEHYFPYRKVIHWLQETHPSDKILFSGMSYRYAFDFYFKKFDWHPDYRVKMIKDTAPERDSLKEIFAAAHHMDCTIVVHQLAGKTPSAPNMLAGFHIEKVFKNQAHAVAIYTKAK